MGRETTAIVRDRQKAAVLERDGLHILLQDLDHPDDVGDWPLLFWFAPPPAQGTTDQRLRGWLAVQRGHIGRVVYISTSGVYGDCQGRWIDEDEPLKPRTDRARRRVDAETALLQWAPERSTDVVLLRVPGIYGPGRLPASRLRGITAVLRVEDSPFSNRIHADDLAAAALHAAGRGVAGAAYNIADGQPTTMADYFIRAAHLLGLPQPEQVDLTRARAVFTPAMWSFMEESKRLSTRRMREQLGFVPHYAGLEEGLSSCLDADALA